MQLCSEAEYSAALAEFLALATESQAAHRERLLALRDAINAYEVAQGHEPAPRPCSAPRRGVDLGASYAVNNLGY